VPTAPGSVLVLNWREPTRICFQRTHQVQLATETIQRVFRDIGVPRLAKSAGPGRSPGLQDPEPHVRAEPTAVSLRR
jgi:hypothetical protein